MGKSYEEIKLEYIENTIFIHDSMKKRIKK